MSLCCHHWLLTATACSKLPWCVLCLCTTDVSICLSLTEYFLWHFLLFFQFLFLFFFYFLFSLVCCLGEAARNPTLHTLHRHRAHITHWMGIALWNLNATDTVRSSRSSTEPWIQISHKPTNDVGGGVDDERDRVWWSSSSRSSSSGGSWVVVQRRHPTETARQIIIKQNIRLNLVSARAFNIIHTAIHLSRSCLLVGFGMSGGAPTRSLMQTEIRT